MHPGPRPKTPKEEERCFHKQMFYANQKFTLDRVTCVSTACYAGKIQPYITWAREMANTVHCVFIYCRPPIEAIKDFSKHIAKSYDEATQIQWLHDNADQVVARYDDFFMFVPHMVYDYTAPDQGVLDAAIEAQHSVEGWYRWTNKARTGA
jgi:hypothetical protein